jgi:hypothetical protein
MADEPYQQPPPPPPYYQVQPAQPPVYTAPLSQTTQTTYVPQSVAMSGPEEITDYDDTRPAPLGYTPVKRTRKGLIIGGAITLGSVWSVCLLSWAVAEDSRSSGGKNELEAMWVPVLGPFIQLGNTSSATGRVFLTGLGVAQAAGAAMLIAGVTAPRVVLVRNDLVGMELTPMVGPGTTGMMVAGRF